MEVLTVIWSSGSCDDHGMAHSFAGVHGIYKSEASAQQGLVFAMKFRSTVLLVTAIMKSAIPSVLSLL